MCGTGPGQLPVVLEGSIQRNLFGWAGWNCGGCGSVAACTHPAKKPPTRVAAVLLLRFHVQPQTEPGIASGDPCSAAAPLSHPTPPPPCGQNTPQQHQRPPRTCFAARVLSTCTRQQQHPYACTTHTCCRQNDRCRHCAAYDERSLRISQRRGDAARRKMLAAKNLRSRDNFCRPSSAR